MGRRFDPRVFRKNLRRLNALKGMSPTDVAKTISKLQSEKIDPKWYRRLCREGVGQLHSQTRDRLQVIAQFFGVSRAEDLWDEKLITFDLSKKIVPPTYAEYTVKLVELLETRRHDYLRHLILTLHAMEFPKEYSSRSGQHQNHDDEVSFEPEYLNMEDESDDEDGED